MQPLTQAVSTGVTVSLGLLNLVVSLHAAVGADDSNTLRTVCTNEHEATRINSFYRCPACESTNKATFAKAREVDGRLEVIPVEVLEQHKAAASPFLKLVDLSPHPIHEVTSVLMPSGSSYYLAVKKPTKATTELYSLFSWMVANSPEVAYMGKLTLRSATTLVQLTVAGDGTLVLRQMADADLVREHPKVDLLPPSQMQMSLARMVTDELVTPFVEATHGTGAASIIAQYTAAHTPAPELSVVPEFTEQITDITAALEAMLAASITKKSSGKSKTVKVAS